MAGRLSRNTGRPNLLLLTADTLRYDRLSIFGHSPVRTTHIDWLASQGIYFDNCIVQSPWTRASFGSILTSHYPSRHGALRNQRRRDDGVWIDSALRPGVSTAAEILGGQGYHTVCLQANGTLDPKYGLARGFHTYLLLGELDGARFSTRLKDKARRLLREAGLPSYRLTRAFLGRGADASSVTRQLLPRLESSPQPFFFWVNFIDTHCPYNPPLRYLPLSKALRRESPYLLNLKRDPERPLSPGEREYVVAKYDGEVKYIDDAIGTILTFLRGSGLLDRTVIVFLSDHGEEFWDHGDRRDDPVFYGRGTDHGHTLYAEQVRVPLIICYPEMVPQGRRVTRVVRGIDVLPTVLDLLEAPFPVDTLEGVSLSGHWSGDAPEVSAPAFSEALLYGPERKAVTTDGFRLIFHPDTAGYELYDLEKDPAERHDIWSAGSDVGQELSRMLHQWTSAMEAQGPAWQGDTDVIQEDDPAVAERLRALGYLD